MSAATPDSLVCAPPSQAVPVACLALTTAYWLPTTAVKFLRLRYEPVSPWDSITCRQLYAKPLILNNRREEGALAKQPYSAKAGSQRKANPCWGTSNSSRTGRGGSDARCGETKAVFLEVAL